MNDPAWLTATEALKLFRAKKLSPVELMEAVIAHAEAVEPRINAFTYTYFEEALDAAEAAEARWQKGTARPLEGLPVAIKDEAMIAGLPTSNGSLLWQDEIADTTTPVVGRIIEAGGICHARTATPEFSCAAFTWSRLWGVTRNPWNPAFTPGGSSGGAAAALAAGSTTLANGTDIGGSIRIPASCCGLVGYKPPYGRNPSEPPFNLDFFDHSGPMARSVADCILLQNVMCGPHPRDIATLRPKLELPRSYRPVRGMKIAVSPDLGAFVIDPQVAGNTRRAVGVFRDLGAEVEEVDLGWGPEALRGGLDYLEHIFGTWIGEVVDGREDEITPYALGFAEGGRRSTPAHYLRALETCAKMYERLGALFERFDALICPTTAIPAVKADHDPTTDAITIGGVPVDPVLGWVLTVPFNMLSRCPVLTVPSGRARSDVPTGIQIVGPTYSDETVFRLATAYEAEAGPWFRDVKTRPVV